uniref:FinTRIM family, member 83 n=1 Tax=Gadus morhua TaxID=8049 RepID=A0A8C5FUA0_GADMO
AWPSCYLDCQESLRDPVSIPCGHVFCSICLKTYWDHTDPSGSFLCPQCRVSYHKRPTPRRVGSSPSLPRRPPPTIMEEAAADVGCDICVGKKHKAVKSCLMCLASYCEKHLKPHYESATFKRHKLVDEIGHLDRQICPQHQKGLELFCKTDQMCICVLCTVKEHKGHDMVSAEQERAEEQQRLGATQAEIQERIHDRMKQMEELKQAVDSLKVCNSAQQAMQECEKLFSDMLRSIEKMQQEMSKLISSNKRAALSNAEGHMDRLTHEIADLKRRDNEITQLSRTEDHIHFIQTDAEELPTVSVNPYFSFGQITKSVSDIKQQLSEFGNEELVKMAKTGEWRPVTTQGLLGIKLAVYRSMPTQEPKHREDFLRFACQLTLDPNTAYRQLYLSRNNRKAALKRDPQAYGDSPARFDCLPQVLCKEPLSGGPFYWEVDWSGEGAALGITYKGIKRTGYGDTCRIGYNRKSWSLFCSDSSYSARHSKDQLEINAPYAPRIGVFLDHAGGTLAFYSVGDTMTLIHRFKASFSEAVYAGFWVWYESAITIGQL